MHKEAVYIYGRAQGGNMPLTMKGVTMSHIWHKGKKRDNGQDYIIHPLDVCRTLLNLNNPLIVTDTVTCAGLNHDVTEEEGVGSEILRKEFGEDTSFLVGLVTRIEGETKREYFKKVASDPRSILIKGVDRFWNLSSMVRLVSESRDIERLEDYIEETECEKFGVLKMLKDGRRLYSQYSDAFVLLRDIIENCIDEAKCFLAEMKENERLKYKIRLLETKFGTN